jgi:hypothetical protein
MVLYDTGFSLAGRSTERAHQFAKYMTMGTVLRRSDDGKNRPLNPLSLRFLMNGQPESHRAMEAER